METGMKVQVEIPLPHVPDTITVKAFGKSTRVAVQDMDDDMLDAVAERYKDALRAKRSETKAPKPRKAPAE